MAYVEARSANRKLTVLTAVAAIHALAVYGLISGFAATVWEKVDVLVPIKDYPADPPPPQPVAEPEKPLIDTTLVAPKPLLPLPPRDPGLTVLPIEGLLPPSKPLPAGGEAIFIPPISTPTASLVRPKVAVPVGDPGRWATTEDYPAAELRREIQGTARFRVSVGTDGRVQACEIVASSGSPGLDKATCDHVSRRARFKPATDESGAKVTGSYSNAVSWVIPD